MIANIVNMRYKTKTIWYIFFQNISMYSTSFGAGAGAKMMQFLAAPAPQNIDL
jgi:hypothetical protein